MTCAKPDHLNGRYIGDSVAFLWYKNNYNYTLISR